MANKIDRRKTYIMVLDTETCNGFTENGKLNLDFSLVYDIGYQVIDKKGHVYERKSYAIEEIFCGMPELMQSSYYAEKIPSYYDEIEKGEREVASIWKVRREIREMCETYNIKAISAHNARFDLNALNNSVRYISGSACRYFFPFGVEIWDTLKMARQTINKEVFYTKFCRDNGYVTRHKTPQNKLTAEVLYKYISGNHDFEEVHKGIDDVIIESEILVALLRKHKKMEKTLFKKVA